ncbi:MAG: hypothetical protein ABIU63_15910 [Chitinophagaceae bacterium]
MANNKTIIDEWEVTDLEDNSKISVSVIHNTEMGNQSVPGIQVMCAGQIVNYEPLHVARWAYQATKAKSAEYLVADASWLAYEDTYIKHILLVGSVLKAKIEVKVRSSANPVIKEYELPFAIDQN